MKQTAVEWYAEQSMRLELERAKGNISINEMLNQLSNVLEQAKEMEKRQIIQAYETAMETDIYNEPLKIGKDYYEQTFKSE
jgi:hypothetical protein